VPVMSMRAKFGSFILPSGAKIKNKISKNMSALK